MSRTTYLIVFSFFFIMTACKSNDTSTPVTNANAPASPMTMVSPAPSAPAPNAPASGLKTKVDVCSLLEGADLKNIQGEQPKETQRSDREDAGFIVTQCYYSLPTSSSSVVLNVTTASESAGARDPREFWKETFARKAEKKEPDEKREGRTKEGEGEERAAPPQKIAGLGEDAYWIASRVGGALYVLKKDLFFRISVGGPGDANAKLKKSKALAQRALKRI
ncbi:MAG: hypothetical protein DMF76_03155 [Acidobacteria bacterium]|nr:MAG: hypothetical protein DMF76_03155 [Acidobacteriota bacterium]